MKKLIRSLKGKYPDIAFVQGDTAQWSSTKRQIIYVADTRPESVWALLHELGHALLGHDSYASDVELLQKEAAAWANACSIALGYKLQIDLEHIEACLDTYRDWLHKRSTCPDCSAQGLQQSKELYSCFNCQATWKVTEHRFCRPYRLKIAQRV
jgi:hypothetical protein